MKHWELHRVVFLFYKEHSIKCFLIWTGGVELTFFFFLFSQSIFLALGPTISLAPPQSVWHFVNLCSFPSCLCVMHMHLACSLVDRNPLGLPLEMLITRGCHCGFPG